jgi:hypothetical protein
LLQRDRTFRLVCIIHQQFLRVGQAAGGAVG